MVLSARGKTFKSIPRARRIKYRRATNFYETLGIARTTEDAEITKIARRLRFKLHPDKVGNSERAKQMYHCIDYALDVMTNKAKRKRYDNLLDTIGLPRHGDIYSNYTDIGKLLHAPECPICMEAEGAPYFPPCGHSLCYGCLDKLTKKECPLCREHIPTEDTE